MCTILRGSVGNVVRFGSLFKRCCAQTYHQRSRKESSLYESEEEASSHHAGKVVGDTGEGRDHAPEEHDD